MFYDGQGRPIPPRRAIPVDEAHERLAARVGTIDAEDVPLFAAVGRSIAEAVRANAPLPHYPLSGMDGYAVKGEECASASPDAPVRLRVVESVPAGSVPKRTVDYGTAVRIMTGGPIPEGATAVVMLEQTETSDADGETFVAVKAPVAVGQHIAVPGEEIAEGRLLVREGTKLNPGHASLLAAFGRERVRVYRKPRVAIVSTGDEIVPIDRPAEYGKVRNSNAYMLAAQVAMNGGEPVLYGIVPDEIGAVAEALDRATAESDVVVTSGGVSVGDYDVMAAYFRQCGDAVLFDKVSMRPGAPTTAAWRDGKFLFGLSGNPGACFVGFELFVRPVLRAMLGGPFALPRFAATLGADFPKPSPHRRFLRGRYRLEDGQAVATPFPNNKSSMMLSIPDANALIVIPPGGAAQRGVQVEVIPIDYAPWHGE